MNPHIEEAEGYKVMASNAADMAKVRAQPVFWRVAANCYREAARCYEASGAQHNAIFAKAMHKAAADCAKRGAA